MAQVDLLVDSPEIARIRDACEDEYQDVLVAQYRSMVLAVEALNETWKGPNHDDFVAKFVQRQEGLDEFHSLLSAFLRSWGDVYYRYNECDDAVAGYIR